MTAVWVKPRKKQLEKPLVSRPQGAPAVAPLVAERYTVAANDVVAGPAGVACTDREAGSEDNTIDLVRLAVDHNARRGDTLCRTDCNRAPTTLSAG